MRVKSISLYEGKHFTNLQVLKNGNLKIAAGRGHDRGRGRDFKI